jgi:hypothetical protein
MQMRLYPSPLIALGIPHQVEIFLHEIGVDEFQPDLLSTLASIYTWLPPTGNNGWIYETLEEFEQEI